MRLFSVKEHKDKAEEKATLTRSQLLFMSDSVVKATQELNQLRDTIKQETALKKQVIEESIAPLQAQKAELERAIASAENRRKEIWLPFKGERSRLAQKDKELAEREKIIQDKEHLIAREEAFNQQKRKDLEDLMKENRKASVQFRRANQKIETLKNLQQTTLNQIEKDREKLRITQASFIEKEAALSERESKMSLDRQAAIKYLRDREMELKRMSAVLSDDRAKLKAAITFAKQKYGIRSTRSK